MNIFLCLIYSICSLFIENLALYYHIFYEVSTICNELFVRDFFLMSISDKTNFRDSNPLHLNCQYL